MVVPYRASSYRAMAAALSLALATQGGLAGTAQAATQPTLQAAAAEATPQDAPTADAARMLALETEVIAHAEAGRSQQAHAALDALIDLEIAAYGLNDWRVANSLSYRASLLERDGDFVAAEAARRSDLSIRRTLGDSTALADARISLALNLSQQRRLTEALAEAQAARVDLAVTPQTAEVRRQLTLAEAHVLSALDRSDEATAILAAADAEALAEGAGRVPDAQQLSTRIAHALAVALTDAGRAKEAEPIARRACVDAAAATPPQPDLVAAGCFVLAAVLEDLDRAAEARPVARQSLEAEEALTTPTLNPANRARAARLSIGAPDEPDHERRLRLSMQAETEAEPGSVAWANAANALAIWLTTHDRAAEAEPLARQAVAVYAAEKGIDDYGTVIVRGNLVNALHGSGRIAEAETEALSLLPHALQRSGLMSMRYVLLEALSGRPVEAERLVMAMVAEYEAWDEPTRARRIDLYSRLANLASDRADWQTTLGWRLKVLEIERAEGTVGRDLMTATAYYGRAALETRDYVLAYRYLTQAGDLLATYEDVDPDRRASDRLYLARHLASAALYQGYDEEADRLSQQALDGARSIPGSEQTEISVLIVRSDLMSSRSDLEAAERYLNQALDLARREDDQGESASVVEGQLSFLWKMMGRYEEAETAMRNVIDQARRMHGPESLATAVPLKNLALLLSETNRSDRALPLLQQAAAIEAAWLPPEHAERMLTEIRLATLMTDAGDAESAVAVLERVADQAEARLGAGHWVSLQARERMGWALAGLERYDEAADHFQRTVLAVEDARGPDAFELMGPLQALAYALYMDGRFEETLAIMRRSAEVGDAGGGRWQRSLSSVKSNLGVTLMALGRPREALEPLRQAAELSRAGVVNRSGEGMAQIDPDRFAFRKLVQALFLSSRAG